ncbi:hypothetical protein R1sor_017769 [Riccia sorocarpa]|uniref:KAT8 regulatory NSL complex subunit 2 n=1 Tax=Riccia sorocarpa TaxID=122646 RepID=A0ABD3IBU6_9MARC
MGSTSRQTKLVKKLASISSNLASSAVPASAEPATTEMPTSKKLTCDPSRPTATTDSCSRCDNSEASETESDYRCESSVEGLLPEDEALKSADALTREEVVQRRARRVRQLMKLYRTQYWGLLEEMRTKYRRFYLRHGKSGWRDDVEGGERERDSVGKPGDEGGDGMREPPERGNVENLHCGAQGCSTKPLPLSVFCFSHILQEPRQRLYKPCSFVIRTGPSGGTTCGRPVLRAVVPPLCGQHFRQAQRQATRSLKKVLPGGSKVNPKLHLIITQYVQEIQAKRRAYKMKASFPSQMENGGETPAGGSGVLVQSSGVDYGSHVRIR